MKKALSSVLIVLLLVSVLCGCRNGDSPKQRISASKSKEVIEIYYPRRIESTPTDDHVKEWEKYIRSKYGIRIELNNLSEVNFEIDSDELLDISDGRGFLIIGDRGDLNELIGNDMIMPVNFYLETLGNYKNISSESIDSFTDSLGNAWGLPISAGQLRIDKRTYNKEWLDGAGISVPTTIEEFYDYAQYVRTGDPDGNGKHDTYIADYTERRFFRQFGDVFRAFGCYPNYSLPIDYNPLSMKFENIILSENFIEAMTFIKSLKDQGLIVNSDETAEEYMVASDHGYPPDEYIRDKAYGFYLTGPNDRMLIKERYSEYCMVVLKHTDSAAEKLDGFYNMIYSDTSSFMDFAYGIKDIDYFDMIDHYKTDRKFVSGEASENMNIYIDLNRVDMRTKPIINTTFEVSREMIIKKQETLEESWEANEAARMCIGTGLSYKIDFDVYDYEVREVMRKNGNYMELITDILTNNVPIEDAVTEYRRHMELFGWIDDLERINNR